VHCDLAWQSDRHLVRSLEILVNLIVAPYGESWMLDTFYSTLAANSAVTIVVYLSTFARCLAGSPINMAYLPKSSDPRPCIRQLFGSCDMLIETLPGSQQTQTHEHMLSSERTPSYIQLLG